jgi:hypothetical protein
VLIIVVLEGGNAAMIGTRVAFRGAFGPHEGTMLEETDDSVVLAVENRDPPQPDWTGRADAGQRRRH